MPTKLKRLLKPTEQVVKVDCPLSFGEIKQRHRDYHRLSTKRFSRRTLNAWTRPASLTYCGKQYEIEVNFCVNPFCQ